MARNGKKVTVVMDVIHDRKLRKLQAKVIADTEEHYSYSRALNDVLKKGFSK